MLSTCRPRKNQHGKPAGYHSYNRRQSSPLQQQSCFRNPIVVFCLSFLALGSLRFRVRTKQAAANLIQRGRQRIIARNKNSSNNRNNGEEATKTTTTTTTTTTQRRTLAYELVVERNSEHGPPGNPIQRYRAVWVDPATSTGQRLRLREKPTPVSVYEWTNHVLMTTETQQQQQQQQQPSSLLDQFIQILQSGNSYAAYFFETKGVTPSSARTKQFEFVLVDAPQLHSLVQSNSNNMRQQRQRQQPRPFAEHLDACAKQHLTNCVFSNLARDATLIAPVASDNHDGNNNINFMAYTHLANFVRHAPYHQVHDFWVVVLQTYLDKLETTTATTVTKPLLPIHGNTRTPAHDNTVAEPAPKRHRRLQQGQQPQQQPQDPPKNEQIISLHHTPGGPTTSNAQQQLGTVTATREEPVWLSTSGMGVPWLHMRLDQNPKYYTYQPFAKEK